MWTIRARVMSKKFIPLIFHAAVDSAQQARRLRSIHSPPVMTAKGKLDRLCLRARSSGNPCHSDRSPPSPQPQPQRPPSSGPHLLRRFLTALGNTTILRPLIGNSNAITANRAWSYTFRQGRDATDLDAIRQQLNGRLYHSTDLLQAGSWTRLLLGDDYTAAVSRKQIHLLTFTASYCVCLTCRINAAKSDRAMDDLDELLNDAEQATATHTPDLPQSNAEHHPNPPNTVSAQPQNIETALQKATLQKLPHEDDFQLIGERLESHELELGTVSKIGPNSAKVTFSSFAKQFFTGNRYCGPISSQAVMDVVAERAKQHYRQHKGKTERRFYVHGSLNRFMLEGTSLVIFPPLNNKKPKDIVPHGVIFRRQMMSIAIGRLALEDSFGAFLHTDNSFYIGFGHDPSGAQSILSDGHLGQARHLGINELCIHTDFNGGQVEAQLL